jgi:hypothetical protein
MYFIGTILNYEMTYEFEKEDAGGGCIKVLFNWLRN